MTRFAHPPSRIKLKHDSGMRDFFSIAMLQLGDGPTHVVLPRRPRRGWFGRLFDSNWDVITTQMKTSAAPRFSRR
ncbi:MAG: hypothetical protein LAT67_00800 [Balneolales bacterium]|nr:hypothetical protein [Balneolales bacterium]